MGIGNSQFRSKDSLGDSAHAQFYVSMRYSHTPKRRKTALISVKKKKKKKKKFYLELYECFGYLRITIEE